MMSQDSPVGFVLFGLGRAGYIHANTLVRNPQARLKYIVDIDEDKAKQFVTSNYLDTKVVPPTAVETVLNDSSVNAAVIATPTHAHEDLVLSCIKAGKAIFCEKPIATTVETIGKNFVTSAKLSGQAISSELITFLLLSTFLSIRILIYVVSAHVCIFVSRTFTIACNACHSHSP